MLAGWDIASQDEMLAPRYGMQVLQYRMLVTRYGVMLPRDGIVSSLAGCYASPPV